LGLLDVNSRLVFNSDDEILPLLENPDFKFFNAQLWKFVTHEKKVVEDDSVVVVKFGVVDFLLHLDHGYFVCIEGVHDFDECVLDLV